MAPQMLAPIVVNLYESGGDSASAGLPPQSNPHPLPPLLAQRTAQPQRIQNPHKRTTVTSTSLKKPRPPTTTICDEEWWR
jgi:hypothetical protein